MKQYILSYNDLNFREQEKDAPPNSLDITPQEASTIPDDKLSKLALKLIRRLLVIADSDYTAISHQDREWLEEILSGNSFEEIARRSKYSKESVRLHVMKAFDVLAEKIETWEERQGQAERILQLESDNKQKDEKIRELEKMVVTMKDENDHLHSVLGSYSEIKLDHIEKRKLDDPTRDILMRPLRGLGVPTHFAKIFVNNNINRVIDLVLCSEEQLLELDGVSEQAVLLIKRILKRNGLELNSNIRWSPEDNAYYVYITEK